MIPEIPAPDAEFTVCLRIARVRRGLSQAAAARALGVSEKTWRNWEAGRNIPIRFLRQTIDRAFGDIMAA